MLERDEIKAKSPVGSADDRRILTGLHQAALKAEAVTGDPNWDTFLSYVQRAIEVAEKQTASLEAALRSPQMVEEAKIAQTRNAIFQLDERIRCLGWVVNMPAEIKRVGSVAKDRLAQMDVVDEGAQESDAA